MRKNFEMNRQDRSYEDESRFRKVFEEGPLSMALIGLDHSFIQANAQFAAMLGYHQDELEKLSLAEITHPDDLSEDLALVDQLLIGEIPHYSLEKRYIKKDGTIIWGKLTASLVRDNDEVPLYFMRMVEDITAHKKAELALRQSEARFKAFMDNSPALAFIRDAEGRYVYINKRLEDLYEVPFRELKGKTLFECLPHDLAANFAANDRAVLDSMQAMEFEEYAMLRDGTMSTWLTSKFPMTDSDGQTLLAGVAIDVSKRKRAEAQLRDREERMQTIMHNAHEGIWVLDANERTQYTNPRILEMLGYTEAEMHGRPVTDFVIEEDTSRVADNIHRRMAGISSQYDCCMRCKNGSLCWVLVSGSPIFNANGKPVGSMGMLTDITERRRSEEAQRHYTQRLQTLHEIDQAVLAAESSRTVAEAVVQRLPELLPCQQATVSLYDLEEEKLIVLAQFTDIPCKVIPEDGNHPLLLDLHSLQPHPQFTNEAVCEYIDLSTIKSPPPWIRALQEAGIQSGLTVPLVVQGELIGTLKIWSRELNAFSQEHHEIACEVADSLAVAIAQANLHQRVLESSASLQAISRRLVDVQEVERRNLARELHDQVGQDLTALKIALEMGARGNADSKTAWAQSQSLVNDLMARVRQLSFDLRPAMLDDLGLIPALVWQFERYTAQTGIEVVFKHTGAERRFDPRLETAAYRIVQEALTNVARHASVAEVVVRLWADSELVGVQIQDEGVGFVPQNHVVNGKSLGLNAMRERAHLLQGVLTIESAPGEGTCVTAEIPLGHMKTFP